MAATAGDGAPRTPKGAPKPKAKPPRKGGYPMSRGNSGPSPMWVEGQRIRAARAAQAKTRKLPRPPGHGK